MATSKSTWLALAIAVSSLSVAAIFYAVIFFVFPLQQSEALESLTKAGGMLVLIGAPTLVILCQHAVDVARHREEVLPEYAIRSRNLALVLTGSILLFFIIPLVFTLLWGLGVPIY